MSLLNKLLGKEESQNKDKYSVQEKSFNSIEKIDESIFESAELLQIASEGGIRYKFSFSDSKDATQFKNFDTKG